MHIPWRRLSKEPTIVTVENVLLLAQLKSEFNITPEFLSLKAEQEYHAKQKALALLGDEAAIAEEPVAPEKPQKDSFLKKIAQTIVSNLELRISNVHVRVEKAHGALPFAAGLTVARLGVQTCDRRWRPTPVAASGSPFFLKLAHARGLSVYLDTQFTPLSALPERALLDAMRAGGAGAEHRFILEPFDINAHARAARNPDEPEVARAAPNGADKQPARVSVKTEIEKLHLAVSSAQIACLRAEPLHLIGFGALTPLHGPARPAERPAQQPGAWWQYVLAVARARSYKRKSVDRIRTWASRAITRETYLALLATDRDEVGEETLVDIERTLDLDKLKHFRRLARAEAAARGAGGEESRSFAGWLPFVKNKGVAQLRPQELSRIERLKLFMSLEEVTPEDDDTPCAAEPAPVLLRASVSLGRLEISIFVDRAVDASYPAAPGSAPPPVPRVGARFTSRQIATLAFAQQTFRFVRTRREVSLSATVGDIVGTNTCSDGPYRVFLKKLPAQLEGFQLNGGPSTPAAGRGGSRASRPLIKASMVFSKRRNESSIEAEVQRLQVIATTDLFDIFAHLSSTNLFQSSSADEDRDTPGVAPVYTKVRAVPLSELRQRVQHLRQPHVNIKFRSPIVFFPNPSASSFLLLDLGLVNVTSEPGDFMKRQAAKLSAEAIAQLMYHRFDISVRNVQLLFSKDEHDIPEILRGAVKASYAPQLGYNFQILKLHALGFVVKTCPFSYAAGFVPVEVSVNVPSGFATTIDAHFTSTNISPVKEILRSFLRSLRRISKTSRKVSQSATTSAEKKRREQFLSGLVFPVDTDEVRDFRFFILNANLTHVVVRVAWEDHGVYANQPLLSFVLENVSFDVQKSPLALEVDVAIEKLFANDLTAPEKDHRLVHTPCQTGLGVQIRQFYYGHPDFPHTRIVSLDAIRARKLDEISPDHTRVKIFTDELFANVIRSSVEALLEFFSEIRDVASGGSAPSSAKAEGETAESNFFKRFDTYQRHRASAAPSAEAENFSSSKYPPTEIQFIAHKLSALVHLRTPVFHLAVEGVCVTIHSSPFLTQIDIALCSCCVFDMSPHTVHREVAKVMPVAEGGASAQSRGDRWVELPALRMSVQFIEPLSQLFCGQTFVVRVVGTTPVYATFTFRVLSNILELIYPIEENLVRLQRKLDAKLPEVRSELDEWRRYIGNRIAAEVMGFELDLKQVFLTVPTYDAKSRAIVISLDSACAFLEYEMTPTPSLETEEGYGDVLKKHPQPPGFTVHPAIAYSEDVFPNLRFCPWMCIRVQANGASAELPRFHTDPARNTFFKGIDIKVNSEFPVLLPRTLQMMSTGVVPEQVTEVFLLHPQRVQLCITPAMFDTIVGMFLQGGIFLYEAESYNPPPKRSSKTVEAEILERSLAVPEFWVPPQKRYSKLPPSHRVVISFILQIKNAEFVLAGAKNEAPPPERENTAPFSNMVVSDLHFRMAMRENLDKDYYGTASELSVYDSREHMRDPDKLVAHFSSSSGGACLNLHGKLYGPGGMINRVVCDHLDAFVDLPFYLHMFHFWDLPVVSAEAPAQRANSCEGSRASSQSSKLTLSFDTMTKSDSITQFFDSENSAERLIESSERYNELEDTREDESGRQGSIEPFLFTISINKLSVCTSRGEEPTVAASMKAAYDYYVRGRVDDVLRDMDVSIHGLTLSTRPNLHVAPALFQMSPIALSVVFREFSSPLASPLSSQETKRLEQINESGEQSAANGATALQRKVSVTLDGGEIMFAKTELAALIKTLQNMGITSAEAPPLASPGGSREPSTEGYADSLPAARQSDLTFSVRSKLPLVFTIRDGSSSLVSFWLSDIDANAVLGRTNSLTLSCTPSLWNHSQRVGLREPIVSPFKMFASLFAHEGEFSKVFIVIERSTPLSLFVTPQVFQNVRQIQSIIQAVAPRDAAAGLSPRDADARTKHLGAEAEVAKTCLHRTRQGEGVMFLNSTGHVLTLHSLASTTTEVIQPTMKYKRGDHDWGVFIPIPPIGRSALYKVDCVCSADGATTPIEVDVSKPVKRLISLGTGHEVLFSVLVENSCRVVTFAGRIRFQNAHPVPFRLRLQFDGREGARRTSERVVAQNEELVLAVTTRLPQKFFLKTDAIILSRFSGQNELDAQEGTTSICCPSYDVQRVPSTYFIDCVIRTEYELIHRVVPPLLFVNTFSFPLGASFATSPVAPDAGPEEPVHNALIQRHFPAHTATPIYDVTPEVSFLSLVFEAESERSRTAFFSLAPGKVRTTFKSFAAEPCWGLAFCVSISAHAHGTLELIAHPFYTVRNSVPPAGHAYAFCGVEQFSLDLVFLDRPFGARIPGSRVHRLPFGEEVEVGPVARRVRDGAIRKFYHPVVSLGVSGTEDPFERSFGLNLKSAKQATVLLLPFPQATSLEESSFSSSDLGLSSADARTSLVQDTHPSFLAFAVTTSRTNGGLTKHFELTPRYAIANNLSLDILVETRGPRGAIMSRCTVTRQDMIALPPFAAPEGAREELENFKAFFAILDSHPSGEEYESVTALSFSCALSFDTTFMARFSIPVPSPHGSFANVLATVQEYSGTLVLVLTDARELSAPVVVTNEGTAPIHVQQAPKKVQTYVKEQLYNESQLEFREEFLPMTVDPSRLQKLHLCGGESTRYFPDDPTVPVWLEIERSDGQRAYVNTQSFRTYKGYTDGFDCAVCLDNHARCVRFGKRTEPRSALSTRAPTPRSPEASSARTQYEKRLNPPKRILRADIPSVEVRLFTSRPEEMFRLTVDHLLAGVDLCDEFMSVGVRVDNLQIDDMREEAVYPVVLARDPFADATAPFLRMKFKRFSATHIAEVLVALIPLKIAFSDGLLAAGLQFVAEVAPDTRSEEPAPYLERPATVEFPVIPTPHFVGERAPLLVSEPMARESYVFIEASELHPVQVSLNLAFSQVVSSRVLGPVAGLINSVSSVFGNVEDATIFLPPQRLENCIRDVNTLKKDLFSLYINSLKRQVLSVLSATTIVGSLMTVRAHLMDGVADVFVNSVCAAKNFTDFGEKFSASLRELMWHVTAAGASLISSVTGSVARVLMTLSANEHARLRREKSLRRSQHSLATAALESLRSVGRGFKLGVLGVYFEPRIGFLKNRKMGAVSGLGKGLVGLVALPVSGVIDVVTHLALGAKHKIVAATELRRRFPALRVPPGTAVITPELLEFLEVFSLTPPDAESRR
eukprot:gnl/Chilomastix_cuspidata/5831.p1 GENE.gnl/Chilomastix_cuspidata/5831~~gnl/Chilomastix_cuspidata/5831.p1  ORF type:complete len:3276 (-),score=740.82 gnl/Chilomastix_cuspidata/5831:1367-10960(-)